MTSSLKLASPLAATIRETSLPSQWKHVNSAQNPADDASRGLSAEALLKNQRWLRGPEFLWKSEDCSPCPIDTLPTVGDNDPEVKANVQNFAVVNSSHITMDGIIERFSSWMELRKCVAWLLRYRRNLLKKIGRDEDTTVIKPDSAQTIKHLTVDEIECGEKEIVKFVQSRSFQDEINSLTDPEARNTKTKFTIKKSSVTYKLDPRMINGVLCVGGRLTNAPIIEGSKHPVIIPKNSGISDLVARHFHHAAGHSGLEHVLSLIRERFWLIGARVILKKMLNNCVSCKKRQAAVAKQKMAALPYHRVTLDKPPFTFVGVDCFGPFTIK